MSEIYIEIDELRKSLAETKMELEVMQSNVRELNEQLYEAYKRIKDLGSNDDDLKCLFNSIEIIKSKIYWGTGALPTKDFFTCFLSATKSLIGYFL